MLKSYLTLALRGLRRHAGMSAITIGGLSLALAAAFLIAAFVRHERSYDDFHERGDRLYRIYTESTAPDNAGETSTNMAAGLVPMLEAGSAGIETLFLYEERTPYLRVGGNSQRIGPVGLMSQAGFSALSFPLREGMGRTALVAPNSIVLTPGAARALFGRTDVVGERLTWGEDLDLTVTGVLNPLPTNTHFQFSALVPFELVTRFMGEDALSNMSNWNYTLYALLTPGSTPEAVQPALQQVLVDNFGDENGVVQAELQLQRMRDIHLMPEVQADTNTTTDPRTVWMFALIGILILFIAGVNFTNMATARAIQRAREVGVRKTVGAVRQQLASQFMTEAAVSGLLASTIGLGISILALPWFSDIVGTDISFFAAGASGAAGGGGVAGADSGVGAASAAGADSGVGIQNMIWAATLVGAGMLTALASGLYPSLFLSAFEPSRVLKGESGAKGGNALLRKGLIVAQFGIAIVLVIATVSVYNQLQYMKSSALGFDREHVIYAPVNTPVRENFDALRQRVLQNARIEEATLAGNVPGRVRTSRGYNWPGQEAGTENGLSFQTVLADFGYLDTFGLELVAGRDFSRDRPADFENTYILNESAAREIGFSTPESAIGQPFRAWDREMGEIIGVVRDFHFTSLHSTIEPVVINVKPWTSWIAFRVAPGDAEEAVNILSAAWSDIAPGYPFDFRFLDDDFNRLYAREQELGRLFTFFAGLAIFVSCLGLFGLSAFSARRRTKEIGVRKVLGAGTRDIMFMLSREFIRLVALAFVLAAPAAWILMDRWLADFAYRTSVSPWLLLAAGVGALAVALLTVSYQGWRAAHMSPVVSLKTE